jgi:cytochrome P450
MLSAPSLDEQLLAPAFLNDPYPVYRRLRTEAPVYWCAPWECWVLTRYADIQAALREDGRGLSVAGRIQASLRRLPEAAQAQLEPLAAHYAVGLLHADAPDHSRLRALVNKAFNPRLIDAMQPAIQTTVDELLDRLPEAGEVDLIRDFAFPLPATVVALMLGLPVEDHLRVKVWIDQLNAFLGDNRASVEVAEHAQAGLLALREYVRGLAAERSARPREDLISHLVRAGDISDAELLSTCVTFIVGGHVTTTALIGNGLLALFEHPAALEQLRAEPAMLPSAVEEFLRFESPNQRIMRLAKTDVELGGTQIQRGQAIMLLLGAANRDAAQFPEPDWLDLRRAPNRHLAFAAGAHFCLGAPLARLEAQIALRSLLERFPRLRSAGRGADWVRSYTLRVLQSLAVRLD